MTNKDRRKKNTVLLMVQSAHHRVRVKWLSVALAIILVVTISLVIPVFTETDIHVQVNHAGNIQNCWVSTPDTSLAQRLARVFPSFSSGPYTLQIVINKVGSLASFYFSDNVSEGDYVFVWNAFGKPSRGDWVVQVALYMGGNFKSNFTITVSF